MKIYLVMYRCHERAGYDVIGCFRNKDKAEDWIKVTPTTASSGFEPILIKELDTIDQ